MYKIIYNDGTRFQGGNINNSKWNLISKPIKRIEYTIGNRMIVLENYEEYNQLIERGITLFGMNPGKNIRNFYMMGRKGSDVQVIIYNHRKKTLIDYVCEFGTEYSKTPIYNHNNKIIKRIGGRDSTGWKIGLPNLEPHYFQN